MNPFLILFKPLFTLGTWIVTALVAVIMSIGGKFDGEPRTEGAPRLTAYFAEGVGNRPPTFDVKMNSGEQFRMLIEDDPTRATNVSSDTLAKLGSAPEDAVSTLVRLRSDHGRSMVCRLSYDPVERAPEGICVIGEIIYDLMFVAPDTQYDGRPQI